VLRAREGDLEAFSALVECHWMRLVRVARSVVGDADAEDVVQDGLVTAWQKLKSLRDPESFTAWVLRIVVRGGVRRARRSRTIVPLAAVPEPGDRSAAVAAGLVEVERVLAVLAPRQRAVMHLTVVEGMSDSEIGVVMGIAAGSVRAHRRRARDRLRKVLGLGFVPSASGSRPVRQSTIELQ